MNFAVLASWLSQWDPGNSVYAPQCWGFRCVLPGLTSYVCAVDLNLSPHACAASSLPTESRFKPVWAIINFLLCEACRWRRFIRLYFVSVCWRPPFSVGFLSRLWLAASCLRESLLTCLLISMDPRPSPNSVYHHNYYDFTVILKIESWESQCSLSKSFRLFSFLCLFLHIFIIQTSKGFDAGKCYKNLHVWFLQRKLNCLSPPLPWRGLESGGHPFRPVSALSTSSPSCP